MSGEAERRFGIGDADEVARAQHAAFEHDVRMRDVLPTWPMTDEQMAFAKLMIDDRRYRAFAAWLDERSQAGRHRFSQREVPEVAQVSTDWLARLGLLRKHVYDSGAWQWASTPHTRSWFLFILTAQTAVADVEGRA